MENRKLGLLGLAYRAGKVVIGSDYVIQALEKNKIFLVFLDKDLSNDTEKKIMKHCEAKGIDVMRDFSSEELSHSIGKKGVKVIGIADNGFASSFKKYSQ